MAKLNVKIVGSEGDSVLVKYSSDRSTKSIDEYDAVAFQPKVMGYLDIDSFIAGITPMLYSMVERRDASEREYVDLSTWVNHESSHDIIPEEPVVTTAIGGIPAVLDTTNEVQL